MHSKEYISLRITMWVSKLSKCSSSIYCPPVGSQVQGCSRKKQKTPWVQTQFDSRKIAHIPFLRFQRHFLASLLQYTHYYQARQLQPPPKFLSFVSVPSMNLKLQIVFIKSIFFFPCSHVVSEYIRILLRRWVRIPISFRHSPYVLCPNAQNVFAYCVGLYSPK